jgi:hypothetical protein
VTESVSNKPSFSFQVKYFLLTTFETRTHISNCLSLSQNIA